MKPLRAHAYKALPGKNYGSPKEVWGFRSPRGRGTPKRIAKDFLRANTSVFKLEGIASRLEVQRVVESLGASHVILQQRHGGLRIHRAYVTVHVGRDRRVYLVKNRAVPRDLLPKGIRFKLDRDAAERRARRAVKAQARDVETMGVERLWFPKGAVLRPAVKVRLHREKPREEWIVYVDGVNGRILSRYDNLALARGAGLVFDPNPVIALGDWRPLLKNGKPVSPPDKAYTSVSLANLDGKGCLDGPRVSTRKTAKRVRRPDGDFRCNSRQPWFEEVMIYVHVDRAIHYLESLGYRGRRAIFHEPLDANAHGTHEDNSWYSPGLRRLTFGTGGVDDAEDGETILHEFGHALQDAICPDFGQSPQAAAMGEGFGDYFAASFFAAKKSRRYRPTVMTWDAIQSGDGDPPCLRRLDEALTFESFETDGDEHDNGMIWSATLWDIWNALGRQVADRIIIESHFQLDGFTTFARGARAILDADRNLYRSAHAATLRRIFAARGVGPVS